MRAWQLILNIILAPLVIILAVMLVQYWIAKKEPPRSRKPPEVVPMVAVVDSAGTAQTPTIRTFGNVQAYQQTRVASQVGGKILTISEGFQAGKPVAFNDVLLTIDKADYLAAVESQKAALATAQRTLAEEQSRSKIARDDWTASGRRLEDAPAFTLRKPQLAAATAVLASATSALENAELDLDRTEVRAPFAAIVQDRSASPGNVISPGTVLGTLIDRARAEVRLPLTPEQAARLDLPLSFAPGRGALPALEATVTTPSQPDSSWTATITRTEPSIDPSNQVLFVIAEIEKPFDNPDAFLPVGAFVNATLSGTTIPNAHRLPESALIEDRFVWVLAGDNTLRQQPVERLFSEGGFFFATIADPITDPPLQVAIRPLASFEEGQTAEKLDPNAPARPPGPRQGPPGGGKGKRPGGKK